VKESIVKESIVKESIVKESIVKESIVKESIVKESIVKQAKNPKYKKSFKDLYTWDSSTQAFKIIIEIYFTEIISLS
jgi:hypothetical protein